MSWRHTIHQRSYHFSDLKTLLAKASPYRSGDALAGLAAETYEERVAAQMTLADLPLKIFLEQPVIPYETDEVTRLIIDTHNATAFAPISHLTVGGFRRLAAERTCRHGYFTANRHRHHTRNGRGGEQAHAQPGPDQRRPQDGSGNAVQEHDRAERTGLSVRLQPNHNTDDPKGIAASMIDGLLYGSGDAVIGINPATDSPDARR